MKNFKIFLCLILFLMIGFSSDLSVSAEIRNRVVAIVNDELITLHELNTRMKEITGYDARDLKAMDERKYLETRRRIVDLLIDEKIALDKIRELGINVTERQVDAAIEKIKRDNHLTHEDLIAELRKKGLTLENYRAGIRKELEKIQLINFEVKSKIILREEKIIEYYNKHREQFRTYAKVHLATIVLRHEDPSSKGEAPSLNRRAQEILSRLRNGEDFGELARKFSQGPGAKEGGSIGFFKVSELTPKLRKVIMDMSAGEVSAPITMPNGIQIIKVLEKRGGGVRPIEEVRDAIHGILYSEELDKKYSSWIKQLREKAYTKVIF